MVKKEHRSKVLEWYLGSANLSLHSFSVTLLFSHTGNQQEARDGSEQIQDIWIADHKVLTQAFVSRALITGL